MVDKIKHYYKLIKEKKIDIIAMNLGILGVLIGIVFSISIVNQIFVWLILFGVCIRLYDFTEKIEHNIVPYDFNNILPAPKKKSTK